jgi:DNA-directed RNA polymerase specialized sigma24 family protein
MLRNADDVFLAQARDLMLAWARRHYGVLAREEAEDAVQDAIARYLEYRERAEIHTPIKVLMRLVRWSTHDEFVRKRNRERRSVPPLVGPDGRVTDPLESVPAPELEAEYDAEEIIQFVLVPWVRRYRPNDLEIFLQRAAGVDWTEIARTLGVPRNTAIKRGSRLIHAMRCHFSDRVMDDLVGDRFDEGDRA